MFNRLRKPNLERVSGFFLSAIMCGVDAVKKIIKYFSGIKGRTVDLVYRLHIWEQLIRSIIGLFAHHYLPYRIAYPSVNLSN